MSSYLDEVRYNIKHYRGLQHLSQAALAEKCACAAGTIGSIESGKAKPSFSMMVTIAEALQVHPGDLFIKDASRSQAEIKQEIYEHIDSIFSDAREHLKKITEN